MAKGYDEYREELKTLMTLKFQSFQNVQIHAVWSLYRIGYIEQMGTGIMRMRMATKESQVADPEFELSGLFTVSFKKSEVFKRSQSVAVSDNKRITSEKQANNKQIILSYLDEHGQATVAVFAEVLALSESRVRAILSEMVKEHMIDKVGKTKSSYYVLKQSPS